MRIFMPLGFLVVFVIWILYRLIIKKDLKQNLTGLYLGFTFFAVWAVIYFFLLT